MEYFILIIKPLMLLVVTMLAVSEIAHAQSTSSPPSTSSPSTSSPLPATSVTTAPAARSSTAVSVSRRRVKRRAATQRQPDAARYAARPVRHTKKKRLSPSSLPLLPPDVIKGVQTISFAPSQPPMLKVAMSRLGQIAIEFPASDRVYKVSPAPQQFVKTTQKVFTRNDPVTLYPGTGFVVPRGGVQNPATIVTVQMFSGVMIPIYVYPVESLADNATRVVVKYDRDAIIAARRAQGLAVEYDLILQAEANRYASAKQTATGQAASAVDEAAKSEDDSSTEDETVEKQTAPDTTLSTPDANQSSGETDGTPNATLNVVPNAVRDASSGNTSSGSTSPGVKLKTPISYSLSDAAPQHAAQRRANPVASRFFLAATPSSPAPEGRPRTSDVVMPAGKSGAGQVLDKVYADVYVDSPAEPPSNEIRCRGGRDRFSFSTENSKRGLTGETIIITLLTFEPAPSAAGTRGERLRPGECSWVDRPISGRFLIRFETPANAQLKQKLHGSQVDTSPTAAERYPDVRTIPVYLNDPNHYWSFFGAEPVNNFFVVTGHGHFRPGIKDRDRVLIPGKPD